MYAFIRTTIATLVSGCVASACLAAPGVSLSDGRDFRVAQLAAASDGGESNALKISALEALMAAPPERAMPYLTKVLRGRHDDEVKAKALFVLSQIDLPEAEALLIQVAQDRQSSLRGEAIRVIGIGGSTRALATLTEMYGDGDDALKEQIMQAFLIADDAASVYAIAAAATSDEEFDRAARTLGAMGAREELRKLRERGGRSPASLVNAYVIANDIDSLSALAADASDPDAQAAALRSLGIVQSPEANVLLRRAYAQSADAAIREAALNGMMIAGDDAGVLALFRASTDADEKRRLLRTLVVMGSDSVLDIIDATLEDTP